MADPLGTSRITVPILWDTKTSKIVSNDSWSIVKMLATAFTQLVGKPNMPLEIGGGGYPSAQAAEIEAMHSLANYSLAVKGGTEGTQDFLFSMENNEEAPFHNVTKSIATEHADGAGTSADGAGTSAGGAGTSADGAGTSADGAGGSAGGAGGSADGAGGSADGRRHWPSVSLDEAGSL